MDQKMMHHADVLGHAHLAVAVALFGANHGDRWGSSQYWPVWALSLALMPVLYFPCRAFARFKRSSNQTWVRYF